VQIPKAPKRQSSCQSFFLFSGSVSKKAARRMLMKLTPGDNMTKESYYGEKNLEHLQLTLREVGLKCFWFLYKFSP